FTFDKADGEYKLVLDVNKHPYTVKILSTAYPERLYLPGSHQGWNPASAPTLEGNGEGLYEGGVNLVTTDGADCEWKFAPVPEWKDDFGGTITLENGAGTGTYGVSDNIKVPSGYYYIKVDMTQGTFEMLQLTQVGLIGAFNGWGGDADFTYDATTNVWTLTQELPALGDGFKIRFNGGWDVNRGMGGDAAGVVSMGTAIPVYHNGQNMQVAEAGTYTLTLDLSTNPNTMTVTKQ
ncbi:MAG: hypothetical protein LBL97_02455, partial [Prevotellaceae bacterium]|nr:hypothetical protein [Prevotellaceae bacterium]